MTNCQSSLVGMDQSLFTANLKKLWDARGKYASTTKSSDLRRTIVWQGWRLAFTLTHPQSKASTSLLLRTSFSIMSQI